MNWVLFLNQIGNVFPSKVLYDIQNSGNCIKTLSKTILWLMIEISISLKSKKYTKYQEVYESFFCKKYEAFQKLMHDYENLKGYKFLVILVLLTRPWVRVHFKWFIYRYFSNIFRMCSLKSSAPKKNAYFIYFSIFLNSCSDQLNLSSRNVSWIIWIFLIIIMQRNIMNIFVKHYMC